jgi:2-methylcitrate dehydratase PrpD
MLTRGSVGLRDYTDEGLRDPAVLLMADRVTYREECGALPGKGGSSAASIGKTSLEIRTRDGRVVVCRPTSVPGDPANPPSQQLLERKFRDCVSFSTQRVADADVERAIELVNNLENLADATEIMRVLSTGRIPGSEPRP